MHLDTLRTDHLLRALELYDALAWAPDGADEPGPDRPRAALPSFPAGAPLARHLERFADESHAAGGAVVHRYALRLGNRRYPHMKLVLEEFLAADAYVFAVDCHDEMPVDARAPDSARWDALRCFNTDLCGRIEAAWTDAGLPTRASRRTAAAGAVPPSAAPAAPAPPPAAPAPLPEGLAELLACGRRFVLGVHPHPDADALGSALALAHALRARDRAALVVSPDAPPRRLAFLPGFDTVRLLDDVRAELAAGADALIVLDCGSERRIAALREALPRGTPVINVDHHASNECFGRWNLVDVAAPATGSVVLRLLDAWGVPLTPAIAWCCYTALVADTGHFAYANTDAAAHRDAARLIEAGVAPDRVARHLQDDVPYAAMRLRAWCIEHLAFSTARRIAWVAVPAAVPSELGVAPDECEDLVQIPRTVAGVRVALAAVEQLLPAPRGGTRLRCSLRSDGALDVNVIARAFGGGGHARASGMTLDGPLDLIARRVVPRLCQEYRDATGEEP